MTKLITRAIGAPLDRIDGPKKVTGTATYAYEHPVADVTYVFPVQSTIAKGRVISIDASAARALPGVIAVLSHENAPHMRRASWIIASVTSRTMISQATISRLMPMSV